MAAGAFFLSNLFPLAEALQIAKDDTTQWVVLSVGVLATIYLVMRPKLRRRRDPLEAPPMLSLSQQRQIERDLNHLMVEMLETARQMTAQLDTRAARLEAMILEADQKLAALKQAAGASPDLFNSAATAAPTSPPGVAVSPDPRSADEQVEAFKHHGGAGPATPLPHPAGSPPENLPDPRHAEIYAMADQGRTTAEIARLLDRPSGEVELILALRVRNQGWGMKDEG